MLASEISKYGIVSGDGGFGVEYAALEDMDANGIPELIMVCYERGGLLNGAAKLGIWTIQNGKAVQIVNEELGAGGEYSEASIFLVRQSGRTAVCHSLEWYVRDFLDNAGEITFDLYYADGTVKTFDSDKTWTADSIHLYGGGGMWLHDDKAAETIKQVQTALADKAQSNPAPAAGTYGPYTITGVCDGSAYTISFSAAKVEKKTVQIREHDDIDDSYSPYQSVTKTLVTIRPDTKVTVTGGVSIYEQDKYGVPSGVGNVDGNDKYSEWIGGVQWCIYSGKGKESFNWGSGSTWDYADLGEYLIIEDSSAAPSTSGGFTDVKVGAYYEEPVKWAVKKNITSGTSATTFSPDSTCTVAQILTFLWRANGSPEPTGRNPFSDISSGDYYYKAAVWAAGKGLVSGSKFNPNTPCTRSMVVTYLWKLNGSPSATPNSFTDVPANADYAQAVAWAVEKGITAGTSATTFSPDSTCTRGQIVTFLHRAMGK